MLNYKRKYKRAWQQKFHRITTARSIKTISFIVIAIIAISSVSFSVGCGVYRFRDISFPDSIKTVRVNLIGNKATYVNPQLSPNLTETLRRKVVSQTRLRQSNSEDVHWDISGEITGYVITTSGISNQQEVSNRLTVTVHIILNDQLRGEKKEYDVSRGFEFDARTSQQRAEALLLDAIVRDLSDDIFNRLFSTW